MTSISVLVPFRDDGHRGPAMEWIVARWRHYWPEAEVIIRPDDGCDPFSKSQALQSCVREATGDVLILLDADTWCDVPTIRRAVEIAATGRLVQPASKAHRLGQEVTDELLASDPACEWPMIRPLQVEQTVRPVGFLHVLSREVWDTVNGYDPRFRGWGGEDNVFLYAVETLVGPVVRLNGAIYSLWHPRPRMDGRRVWTGQTQRNSDMILRYAKARGNEPRMRELVGEW